MKVICAHLRNDFSGSPRVLGSVLRGLSESGFEVELITAGKEGFLSGIDGITYHALPYRHHNSKLLTFLHFALAQAGLFLKVLFIVTRGDIVYINTLLPFAAAWAAKIRGARVIYHLHEVAVQPQVLHSFLFHQAKNFADAGIYVSNYLKDVLPLDGVKTITVHNALEEDFADGIPADESRGVFRAVMLCSLRAYKGVFEFLQLAVANPDIDFRLVTPESRERMFEFFKGDSVPENLELVSGRGDVRCHYAESDVVLSLSRIDGWVESFGMTILEGMAFGIPAIVPPVGGPNELITEGLNGYLRDSYDIQSCSEILARLASDRVLYGHLQDGVREQQNHFKYKDFIGQIISCFHNSASVQLQENALVESKFQIK